MKNPRQRIFSLMLALMMLLGIASVPARADGMMIVGEVTILGSGSVNLRSGGSTDYPIIGRGKSGEVFKTTGQVESGWYEIILPDERFAYVSNKLVYFYAYPNPIPIGAQFSVPVHYMTTQGQTLKTVNVRVSPGQNIITADDSQVPGYRLVSTRSIYVQVDNTGRAVPNGVIFSYELAYAQPTPTQTPAQQVYFPVYYKDIYNQVIASEYRLLGVGTQLVKADASKLPQGYYVSGASDLVVVVNSDRTTAPREANFIVSRLQSVTPTPSQFYVPVSYRDEAGNVLRTTQAAVQPGYTTVTADDNMVPAGMELTSARSIVVYASSQGVTFPSTVIFTYRAAIKASIQVLYRDAANNPLFNETRQFAPGTHTITADDSRAPSGYQLQGNRSVQVTVYANGTVSQNQVIFTYAMPVSAQLTIEYRDTDGNTLHTETRALGQGTHPITANDGRVGSGYTLQNARTVNVTVYQNGMLSQDRVVFLYARPVSANVTVIYQDNANKEFFRHTLTFSQGTSTVTANDGRAPSGYVLQSARNVQVNVSSAGVANPAQVVFTYAPPAPPVTVNVPVVYKDQDGAILHSTTVSVSSAAPQKITADKSKAPSGYVLSGSSTVTVTVSSAGVASPKEVVFVFRDPATITEAQMLPNYQTFSFRGSSQDVYSGPGTEYYRASNGRAAVSGGRLRVWGTQGDWALIGYGLSNNLYRIGYIAKSALPGDLSVPEIYFGSQTATITKNAPVNDDPIIQPQKIFELKAGTSVTLLAYLDDRWAYIETTFNGQPVRGFVRRSNISIP